MPMTVSFNTANFVARLLDYNMTEGWGQGDRATQDHFRPLDTFGERFEAMLVKIEDMGFDAVDLWLAQLNPPWATAQHIGLARDLLAQHGLRVKSLCGGFGASRQEFEATCRLAVTLECDVLGGGTPLMEKDRPWVVATLKRYGLRLGLENHPEPTIEAVRARMGGDSAGGAVGLTIDTGWLGTQNVNAPKAIEALAADILLVHLKDVRAAGAHDTCRYGEGVVPVFECVQTLARVGYTGNLSIEHEPEHFDPTADCMANLAMVKSWLERVA